ncbi:hypothetical protein BCAR13_520115 [Paraburkholderia caribensis]|nr:hypothetical protein BCAR13_520115 [Paraburkholderia caribensis]
MVRGTACSGFLPIELPGDPDGSSNGAVHATVAERVEISLSGFFRLENLIASSLINTYGTPLFTVNNRLIGVMSPLGVSVAAMRARL